MPADRRHTEPATSTPAAPHELGGTHLVVSDTGQISELDVSEDRSYSLYTPNVRFECGQVIPVDAVRSRVRHIREVLTSAGIDLTAVDCFCLAIVAVNEMPAGNGRVFNAHVFHHAVLEFSPVLMADSSMKITQSFSPDGYRQDDELEYGQGRLAGEQGLEAMETRLAGDQRS